jgi:hypothetical protein
MLVSQLKGVATLKGPEKVDGYIDKGQCCTVKISKLLIVRSRILFRQLVVCQEVTFVHADH